MVYDYEYGDDGAQGGGGYHQYDTDNAIQPGPWLERITMAYLGLVVAALWPLTWLVRRIKKSRKKKKSSKFANKKNKKKQQPLLDVSSSDDDADTLDISSGSDDTPPAAALSSPNIVGTVVLATKQDNGANGIQADIQADAQDVRVDRGRSGTRGYQLRKTLSELQEKSRNMMTRSRSRSKTRSFSEDSKGPNRPERSRSLTADSNSSSKREQGRRIVLLSSSDEYDGATCRGKTAAAYETLAHRAGGRRKSVVTTQLFVATNQPQQASSTSDGVTPSVFEEYDALFSIDKDRNGADPSENQGLDALNIFGCATCFDSSNTESDDDASSADGLLGLNFIDDEIADGGAYDAYEWNELPSHVKEAARVLGYDETSWTSGSAVSSSEKSWDMLSDKEKKAAAVLGYNEQFWDHHEEPADIASNVIRGWETFYATISLDRETRKLGKIAVPATFEAVFGTVLDAVEISIVSNYIGLDALSASAMVDVCLGLTQTVGSGLAGAEEILVSQALGIGDYFLAGTNVQLSAVLYLLVAIPSYLFWIFFVEPFILYLGLDANIAQIAKAYVPVQCLADLISASFSGTLGGLMRIDGKTWQMAIIDSVFSIIHVVAIVVGVIHFRLDLVGIAWIEVVYSSIYGIFMFTYCNWIGWLEPYKRGLFSWKGWLEPFKAKLIKKMLKLAAPIAAGGLLAEGEWSLFTLLAGAMDEADLAAWSIAGAIWEIFEFSPEGISSAAVIRIGYHLGNASPRMAKVAAYKSLLYSGIWSSILTIFFVWQSNSIIAFFTEDEYLVTILDQVVLLIGAGNIIMCFGNMAWNILSAQSRPKIATWVYAIGVVCISTPLAAVFTFVLNYNLQALVSAIIFGYGFVALVLLMFVFTTNWSKTSMKIISAEASRKEDVSIQKVGDYSAPIASTSTNEFEYNKEIQLPEV